MSFRSRLPGRRRAVTTPPIDGSSLGDIDGPTAIIGPNGVIGALDGTWRLEWGAGTGEGWMIAHRQADIRQTRIDDAPVHESLLRVPGGHLQCRVAAATDGVSRWLSIEFVNASSEGLTLGVVLNLVGAHQLSVGRSGVEIDGATALAADRRAGAVVAGPGDPWELLGTDPDQASVEVSLGSEGGHGSMVFPLPHRASLSLRLAVEGDLPQSGASPADIAAGWRAVTRGAASIQTPDDRLDEAWQRVVPDLVIDAGSRDPEVAAQAAPWLDLAGLHDEADRARATVVVAAEDGRLNSHAASAAVEALASRDLRAGKASGIDQLLGELIAEAGDSITGTALRMASLAVATSDSGLADELLAMTTDCISSSNPSEASKAALGARTVLGTLIAPPSGGSIDLLPSIPQSWFGQSLDVRGLATHAGSVSFSIRWHGPRPALLWERVGGPESVEITCRGLDPAWSSSERQAEALLAAPGPPG